MSITLNPLTPDQREKFRAAAKEGTPRQELVCLVGMDTGLRRSAIAHMRGDWVHLRADPPYIRVPEEDDCQLGYKKKGAPNSGTTHCYECGKQRDGFFTPKTENSVRRVFINDRDTQRILEKWFDLHDTVASPSSINDDVDAIAHRTGFIDEEGNATSNGRRVTPHQLRQTYGTRLAEMNHNAHEIKMLMGHSSIRTSQRYIKLYGPQLAENHAKKWNNGSS